MTATATTIQVHDIPLACTVVGDGTPLIVLHGAIGLGSTYMRPLDAWAGDFQLVHYDQRGSGATPIGDQARVSFTGAMADLDELRAALGIDRVNLVGHSAGALLAAMYAGTYPEPTASAVLLNAGPPLIPALFQSFQREMAARRTPEDDAARLAIEESSRYRAGDPQAMERHQLNTFTPFFRDRATRDSMSLGFTKITAANVQAAPQRMIGSLGQLNPMAVLAQIQCPTLIVHGDLDPIPADWSHTLVDTIPNADYALLEGAAHFPHIENQDQLAAAALPWLTKNAT
ncbi:MAG TPA: alpha/beta hydrolase [Actinokineospora sp.]|jgi:proline iminopeptidase|nr:alpha/beta hydrolase [Actinokineospora sp.]